MTSPTTLVATAADYLNRISNQDVAWYNGTHLKDPVGEISPRQKQILADGLAISPTNSPRIGLLTMTVGILSQVFSEIL
jgi:hypothetical protein